MHSEAETLSFVMVEANYDMHAAAKRCTGFRNKVSPLVSPENSRSQLEVPAQKAIRGWYRETRKESLVAAA